MSYQPGHEEACQCVYCEPVAARRSRELREAFSPWWTEPRQLARLWDWLSLRGMAPADPAEFMEHAERDYTRQYLEMSDLIGPA